MDVFNSTAPIKFFTNLEDTLKDVQLNATTIRPTQPKAGNFSRPKDAAAPLTKDQPRKTYCTTQLLRPKATHAQKAVKAIGSGHELQAQALVAKQADDSATLSQSLVQTVSFLNEPSANKAPKRAAQSALRDETHANSGKITKQNSKIKLRLNSQKTCSSSSLSANCNKSQRSFKPIAEENKSATGQALTQTTATAQAAQKSTTFKTFEGKQATTAGASSHCETATTKLATQLTCQSQQSETAQPAK